jgi:hypothetical protein
MATKKDYTEFINRAVLMTDDQLRAEINKIRGRLGIIQYHSDLGSMIKRLEFWTKERRYEFSFQFWGDGQNNVYINRDDVEVASFGGETNVYEILERTLEWCEKSNPRIKYPDNI